MVTLAYVKRTQHALSSTSSVLGHFDTAGKVETTYPRHACGLEVFLQPTRMSDCDQSEMLESLTIGVDDVNADRSAR